MIFPCELNVIREHHSLPEVDYGEDWSLHRVELNYATYGQEYLPGETTGLACDAKTFVTYGFATWRYDGDMQECVAWVLDPEAEFHDCANWGENGHGAL